MNAVNVSILSQIQGRKVRPTLDDVFANWAEVKKDEVRTYTDDVLALSCMIHRTGSKSGLNSGMSAELITQDDRDKAANIRKYYQDKLTLLALKDKSLTKFRKDLHDFVYNHVNTLPDSYVGMVYKLPAFYKYDQEIDGIFKSIYYKNTNDATTHVALDRRLSLIKKVHNKRRSSDHVEYWFDDMMLNKIMIRFDAKNPLLKLFDDKVNQGTLDINTRYYVHMKDFNRYYTCGDNWTFV